MPVMMELQKTVEQLDDTGKFLLLEIAKRFLAQREYDDDELSPHDLQLIKLAEAEYKNGETLSHTQIHWD
jgi:hypothetical protein